MPALLHTRGGLTWGGVAQTQPPMTGEESSDEGKGRGPVGTCHWGFHPCPQEAHKAPGPVLGHTQAPKP